VVHVANLELGAQINVFRKGNTGKLRYSTQRRKEWDFVLYRIWIRKF
jgi:hypothetical protein